MRLKLEFEAVEEFFIFIICWAVIKKGSDFYFSLVVDEKDL